MKKFRVRDLGGKSHILRNVTISSIFRMNFTATNLQECLWVAANYSLRRFCLLDFQLQSRYLFAWQYLAINPHRLLSNSSALG